MKGIKEKIINTIAEQIELDISTIEKLIEIPPDSDLGDYAFPCFHYRKCCGKLLTLLLPK